MPTPYDFLNNYLSKVGDDSGKVDENDQTDDIDFFNTVSDEPQAEEDIQYGISDDDDDDQVNAMFEPSADENPLDQSMGDEDPYSGDEDHADPNYDQEGDDEGNETGGGVEGVPEMTPYTITAKSRSSRLKNDISDIESGGKYSAFNPHGGGGGAVGKYQFRWNIWQDSIKKITGVKSKEQFLKSPEAQEKYFGWYAKNYLKPQAEKLQQYNKKGLTMDQLEKLVHYRGNVGAKKYLQGKLADKPESYNVPISQYIAQKQTGGVAMTPESQYEGLNNENYDELLFPMHGENIFRGLDSGEPVMLQDETGKKKVLRGRSHRTKMTGKVYEKRLK